MTDRAGKGAAPSEAGEIESGLLGSPRSVSSRYFYDQVGSRLFEEISRLPEYYLTRTEETLLRDSVAGWAAGLGTRTMVELGAGSARKTRVILEAALGRTNGLVYVPLDVSRRFLLATAEVLRAEYPGLDVRPVVGEMSSPGLPVDLPRPWLVMLLGSTIGNFAIAEARAVMGRLAAPMEPGDRFLLGIDLEPGPGKSRSDLEAAYNDSRGVTARFNRNILKVLNDRFGTDFQPSRFDHLAFYNELDSRIEMYLVARVGHQVRLPSGRVLRLEVGERIRTEISCKYDRQTVEGLFRSAGLALSEWFQDPDRRYALAAATR